MKRRAPMMMIAAAVVLGAAAPAVAAGPPYTVRVGSSSTGTFTASAVSTGTLTLNIGGVSRVYYNCTAVNGTGRVFAGTAVNPPAEVTSTNWVGCSGAGGSFTLTHSGTWRLVGSSTATTSASDVITGSVQGVSLRFANPVCRFDVIGFARGQFRENGTATQQLVFNETGDTRNLQVANKVGCGTQIQNGNPVNFAGTLNVTSNSGRISLS